MKRIALLSLVVIGRKWWSDKREETEREMEVRGGILMVLRTVQEATADWFKGIFG